MVAMKRLGDVFYRVEVKTAKNNLPLGSQVILPDGKAMLCDVVAVVSRDGDVKYYHPV